MKLYGLTGGIGSGKSEAARLFREQGIPVLDADQIGHAALLPGGAARDAVAREFGPPVLDAEGRIDRAMLAERVFADPAARARLNALTHPVIYAEIARQAGEWAGRGVPAGLVEAALLGEDGKVPPTLSGLVLVSAPAEVRLARLTTLRGMDREDALRRIAAQRDPEEKRSIARWVLDNSGDVAALREQVVRVAGELSQSAE